MLHLFCSCTLQSSVDILFISSLLKLGWALDFDVALFQSKYGNFCYLFCIVKLDIRFHKMSFVIFFFFFKCFQLGWITKVMAGGTGCACKVLNPAPPESEAVFELAASERVFYNQLIKTSNLLLRPLQKSSEKLIFLFFFVF